LHIGSDAYSNRAAVTLFHRDGFPYGNCLAYRNFYADLNANAH
jgi:hypothetical protein